MIKALEDKILFSDENADVGRFTYGRPTFVRFPTSPKMTIGSFCSIADGVTFIMGGEHFTNRVTTYPLNGIFDDLNLPFHERSKGPIIIGSDVWIGYGATILSGVTIGNGAVIGAKAVVASNVKDYSIVAGNPAKWIKDRPFPMQFSGWWDWPLDKIKANANHLMSLLG